MTIWACRWRCIYTKAADVSADLVGKVRNRYSGGRQKSCVIADNVGIM